MRRKDTNIGMQTKEMEYAWTMEVEEEEEEMERQSERIKIQKKETANSVKEQYNYSDRMTSFGQ